MILFNNLLMTFGCDSDTSSKSKGRYIESGRRSFACSLLQTSNLPNSIKRPPLESDLKLAMKMIAQTQRGPDKQIPSMGCNIKWYK